MRLCVSSDRLISSLFLLSRTLWPLLREVFGTRALRACSALTFLVERFLYAVVRPVPCALAQHLLLGAQVSGRRVV